LIFAKGLAGTDLPEETGIEHLQEALFLHINPRNNL
jgi:hypothetical protein